MLVSVYVDNKMVFDLKVRKNCKSIIKEIEKKIQQLYNCTISRTMITGSINFASGIKSFDYVLFGNNLPFRKYNYVINCN